MPAKAKATFKQILEAIRESDGSISGAAEKLDISYQALWERIQRNKTLKKALQFERKIELLDLATPGFKKALKDGKAWAIKYLYANKDQIMEFENAYQGIMTSEQANFLKINRIPIFPGQTIPDLPPREGEVNIMIPVALAGLWQPKRYFIAASGRGAGKSCSFAKELIARSLESKIKVGCFREVQISIWESVYALLKEEIETLGVSQYFNIKSNEIVCSLTSSSFIFKGLKDIRSAESIKSLVGIDIAWVEEGQSLSLESWEILEPTIRKDNSEIWVSMNPTRKEDVVYVMFLQKGAGLPPRTVIAKISWRDNPWFPEVLREKRESDKEINHPNYEHIWEGALRSAAGVMIRRDWIHHWQKGDDVSYDIKFISADTAFSEEDSADYSVLQVWAAGTLMVDGKERAVLDLIDSRRSHWAYPDLFENVKTMHELHMDAANPFPVPMGPICIEAKASGQSLIQSLRAEGIKVFGYNPKTVNKAARVYATGIYLQRAEVRFPQIEYADWVEDCIDEILAFSEDMTHTYDDQTDAMTQAVTIWVQKIRATQ